jgi:hypothetical protein
MKMCFRILSGLMLLLAGLSGYTQNRECGTMLHHQYLLEKYPQLAAIRKQSQVDVQRSSSGFSVQSISAVITIPVVVHVVYNTALQNISDAQIQSQINVLNRDYRRLNADTSKIPAAWKSMAADVNIEFCLAKKDPAGNDTNGITRTTTTVTQFGYDDQVKHTSTKGQDGWDPTKYLNLWVCNLGTSLYGFAQFPTDFSTSPSTDGVVINHTAFGTSGTAKSPSNGGRTCSHEVGHWFNLYHIWGDTNCGDDFVSDTPVQGGANYGCVTYPHVTCSNGPNGDMFMNYMDYGDDPCLVMFTPGQAARMLNAINTYRSTILNTSICTGPSYVGIVGENVKTSFSVYPNPSPGLFTIGSIEPVKELNIFNLLGETIFSSRYDQNATQSTSVDLTDQSAGIYFIKVLTGKGYSTQKLLLNH